MHPTDTTALKARLQQIDARFRAWLDTATFLGEVAPPLLRDAVIAYPGRTAKRMRPALTMLAAGVTGGEAGFERAAEVAFAIELFHTWTLVHDDVIDRDPKRRGKPTVHAWAAVEGAKPPLSLPTHEAAHYGTTVAILAGDLQHGWCNDTILGAALGGRFPAETALRILHRLNRRVLTLLVQGEMTDVDFGLLPLPTDGSLHEEDVVRMLWQKTGALYEFCGETGALLGKLAGDYEDAQVKALGAFASHLGTAFQLQDDVLGIVGTEAELGKPIGADLREGKKTTIVLRALRTAGPSQTAALRATLGNKSATAEQIDAATAELHALGCVDYTQTLAREHLDKALAALHTLPASPWRDELEALAAFTLSRRT